MRKFPCGPMLLVGVEAAEPYASPMGLRDDTSYFAFPVLSQVSVTRDHSTIACGCGEWINKHLGGVCGFGAWCVLCTRNCRANRAG